MGADGGTAEASMSLSAMGNPADLNSDNRIDTADLAILCDSWLTEEVPVKADIDRDSRVNLDDFAELGVKWHEKNCLAAFL